MGSTGRQKLFERVGEYYLCHEDCQYFNKRTYNCIYKLGEASVGLHVIPEQDLCWYTRYDKKTALSNQLLKENISTPNGPCNDITLPCEFLKLKSCMGQICNHWKGERKPIPCPICGSDCVCGGLRDDDC